MGRKEGTGSGRETKVENRKYVSDIDEKKRGNAEKQNGRGK